MILRNRTEEPVQLDKDNSLEFPLLCILYHLLQCRTLFYQFPTGNAFVLVELHDFHAVIFRVLGQLLDLRFE